MDNYISQEKAVQETTLNKMNIVIETSDNWFNIFNNILNNIINEGIDTEEENGYSKMAVLFLSIKLFRILRAAHYCVLNSHYDIAYALHRMAFEAHLLMVYLSNKDKESEDWYNGKQYKPSYLRKQVGPEYSPLYKHTSLYVHPNILSILGNILVYTEKGANIYTINIDTKMCNNMLFGQYALQHGTTLVFYSIFQERISKMSEDNDNILSWMKLNQIIYNKLKNEISHRQV